MTRNGPEGVVGAGEADRASWPVTVHESNASDRPGGSGSSGAPRGRDGGQLLGTPKDAGGVRSRWPGAGHGSSGGDKCFCLACYSAPVTRSPLDPWHSEEYLIGCLIRTHGWHWLEPRVLKGPWRPEKAAAVAREVAS